MKKIHLKNMGKFRCFIIFLSLIIILLGSNSFVGASPKKINVAFVSVTTPQNPFWHNYITYMKIACDSLGMNFNAYYANENHMQLVPIIKSLIKSKQKPSVIVFLDNKMQAEAVIKTANQAKIPIFLVNTSLNAEETKALGKPREKYKYWIGQMQPDDKAAGYLVAKTLFNKFPNNGKKYHVIGINGNVGSDVTRLRLEGLKEAVAQSNNIILDQVVYGNWSPSISKAKFVELKKSRYPNANIIWTASDSMAMGVVQGAKDLKLKPGRDIVTGGIDWLPDALKMVKNKEIDVSVGGHFIEGGWVAVLLYDYFNGKDFASEKVSWKTQMRPITSANVNYYETKLNQKNWGKINFRKFSKKYNPKIKKYDFRMQNILQQL